VTIRTKEEAHDYRYFPEPDLVPMRIADWVPRVEAELPELPDAKRERFVLEYGIADDHAKSLTSEIRVANFYEDVAKRASPRLAAVWIADVLKGELNYRDVTIDGFSPDHMVDILDMIEKGKITEKGAVEVIRTILDEGGDPAAVVAAKGLVRAEDDKVLEAVRAAVEECGQAVADYRSGNEKAVNFIVGMVMKKTRGRADPGEANRLVKEALDGMGGA
ncbi:MAG TPA: Asp-tRNA(Asn)/Glu-tRNA(Gln) amidotransferase GatCAB subunit B, partial [Methanothrix sp.]|nr:Asp-tRNA(Asn)/Glu-tRNA(Gln) amidotransferase GatCAB subunit B [Methanothrix sp.]